MAVIFNGKNVTALNFAMSAVNSLLHALYQGVTDNACWNRGLIQLNPLLSNNFSLWAIREPVRLANTLGWEIKA